MRALLSISALGLGALFLVGTGRAGSDQPPKPAALQVGGRKQDRLTRVDKVDVLRGTRCKEFVIACEAGKTYVLEMTARSTDFDPYLRLNDEHGRQWASDDDGGEGLNARIVFPCSKKGTYILVATTYADDVGDFEVRVRQPEEVGGKPIVKEETLTDGDQNHGLPELPFRTFPVKLERGKSYHIAMVAQDENLKPVLVLKNARGWVQSKDDNRQRSKEAMIDFRCQETDTYIVVATITDARKTGRFCLTIRSGS